LETFLEGSEEEGRGAIVSSANFERVRIDWEADEDEEE